MENINIAELLKNCPKGMELDCTMFENVTFVGVDMNIRQFPIEIAVSGSLSKYLTKEGCFHDRTQVPESKCVIFPKGKTTWEGFTPPCNFKDGDILVGKANQPFIFQSFNWDKESCFSYCGIDVYEHFWLHSDNWTFANSLRFATKEEEEKLLKVIKDNGYNWNSETKTLEKITRPNFKVGDWVTDGVSKCQIHFIDDTYYWYSKNCILGSIESVDKQYHIWTINDVKDGDILFHSDPASSGIFIFKEILQRGTLQKVICHCDYDSGDGFCLGENHTCCWTDSKILRPATKEQRDLLFTKMKEAGYKWNEKTKTLEKLIKPIFKKGDKVRVKNGVSESRIIDEVCDRFYTLVPIGSIHFTDQHNWELVPDKFDISTLKPFDSRVLVRDYNNDEWRVSFWGCLINSDHDFKYDTVRGCYRQCIPYEGNEHLIGKTDDCSIYYKTWE